MKFSWNYLQSFFNNPLDKNLILERLTMAGLEVENEIQSGINNNTDYIIEFKITPNRGDCLSYIGIAREISGLTGLKFEPDIHFDRYILPKPQNLNLSIDHANAVTHYYGRIIHNINNQQSTPDWLVNLLEVSDIRSVSLIVDIINYVMLVYGQPMHAFDLDKIGNNITVRLARQDEQLELLDKKMVKLGEKPLIIADGSDNPTAIAGVMGGMFSGVTNDTSSIFIECANFNPLLIHGVAKHYLLNSDSAYRFERGVDSGVVSINALDYATKLISQLSSGVPAYDIKFVSPNLHPGRIIHLDFSEIDKFVGQAIDNYTVVEILQNLGFIVVHNSNNLTITVPTHRFDINLKEDIIEEIIRVYGYDKIIPQLPKSVVAIKKSNPGQVAINNLKQILVNCGFNEIISYAFIEDKYARLFSDLLALVKLKNPIAGLNVMRQSLLPGLVKTLQYNINRSHSRIHLFELARVFMGESSDCQPLHLAGLIYGEMFEINWGTNRRPANFYDLKAVIEKIFNNYGILEFTKNCVPEFYHPNRSAQIRLNKTPIGFIGQLHPRLSEELDLNELPFVFEINLHQISFKKNFSQRNFSKFQKVSRDLSFVVPKATEADKILLTIKEVKITELISVKIIDLFEGGNLKEDEKSMTFNFLFQADWTLVEDEINSYLSLIKTQVINNFNASLR